ncbi:helix-turn-helix transcriptional regulator [Pseudaquidulcibacter saccharophilus]|uniref:helix-turn-helix transcriptional regulator n=1 Tax=Pseudaquidulcibacter saccharophilus TaxID=2831900 RepID=UPI001EFF55FE|nr:WYL domain-containing protein [Pseudaquidulcibacter saccharophilus]
MLIHFIGKIEEISEGKLARRTACECGDERTHWVISEVEKVNCPKCKSTKIYKHGLSRSLGEIPKTSSGFVEEYDKIIFPNDEEILRLIHYSNWQKIKFLSMIELFLESDTFWLEQNYEAWVKAAESLLSGHVAIAKQILIEICKDKPEPPSSLSKERVNSAIPAVNEFRKNNFRIPEYGTNRFIPSISEFDKLRNKYPKISTLDDAISVLAEIVNFSADDFTLRIETAKFLELATVVAKELIFAKYYWHQKWHIENAIARCELPFSVSETSVLVEAIELAKKHLKENDSLKLELDIDYTKNVLNVLFQSFPWAELTLIPLSIELATLSKRLDDITLKMHRNGHSVSYRRNLGNLASRYRDKNGMIVNYSNQLRICKFRTIYLLLNSGIDFPSLVFGASNSCLEFQESLNSNTDTIELMQSIQNHIIPSISDNVVTELLGDEFREDVLLGCLINSIHDAIEESSFLQITYKDSLEDRRIRPLALQPTGDDYFLFAWCELRQSFRKFRISEIGNLTPLHEKFESENGRTLDDFQL